MFFLEVPKRGKKESIQSDTDNNAAPENIEKIRVFQRIREVIE